MKDTTRCFFALTFDAHTKEQLRRYRDVLASQASRGKFTHSDNFHLTLEFIGHVDDEQLQALKSVLCRLGKAPARLRINRLGAFQIKGRRLVWLGVEDNAMLFALQQQLRQLLVESGFTPENRQYVPHITLGRNVVLKSVTDQLSFNPIDIPVYSLALMESQRIEGKLVYLPLQQIRC